MVVGRSSLHGGLLNLEHVIICVLQDRLGSMLQILDGRALIHYDSVKAALRERQRMEEGSRWLMLELVMEFRCYMRAWAQMM